MRRAVNADSEYDAWCFAEYGSVSPMGLTASDKVERRWRTKKCEILLIRVSGSETVRRRILEAGERGEQERSMTPSKVRLAAAERCQPSARLGRCLS